MADAGCNPDAPVQVSIVHWNRPIECLATVQALNRQGLPLVITVVDNHSSADARKTLTALPGDVELISLPDNRGWGAAHNEVLRQWVEREGSEFYMACAHDALPEPGCLPRLIEALRTEPAWGMACPEYGKPEVPVYGWIRGARVRRVPPRPTGAHEPVSYCHGTLMVFRRACLREIGLFDERYFAYGDEAEIGLRARRFGWKVGLVWGAIVVNPGSWSGNAVIGYLWTRNSLRLARAFGGQVGLICRGTYVAAVTAILWLRRAPSNSLSSPRGRWLGIWDYLRGYSGAPPQELAER